MGHAIDNGAAIERTWSIRSIRSELPVGSPVRNVGSWIVIWLAGFGGMTLGVPVAWLIGPMLAAIALSLVNRSPRPNPTRWLTPIQAVIGVTLGASFAVDGVVALGADAVPIAIAVLLVLLVSIGSGLAMARLTDLDRVTSALGTIPGGATAVVAMAGDLGGETRLVAFMQYARVVIAVVSIAWYAQTSGHPGSPGDPGAPGIPDDSGGAVAAALVTTAVAIVGGWLGLRVRFPAGAFIGPMLLGLAVTASGVGTIGWPPGVLAAAYLLLGTSVGSRFDVPVLLRIWRLLPQILGFIIGLSLICAGIGLVLAATTSMDRLTALLATTPGGIDAAAIAALDSGADVTVVVTIQVLRLLLMVLAGPVLARRLFDRATKSAAARD